MLDMTC